MRSRRRKLASLFALVAGLRDPAVDRALAAALPTADAASLDRITRLILERGRAEGLVGLVREFHRLPRSARAEVTARAFDLFRPLREAMAGDDESAQLNAIGIIRESLAARLAYLVADKLRHGSQTVRDAAAACLLDMAERTAASPALPAGSARLDADATGFLAAAVGEAFAAYDAHRRPAVLLSLVWLWPRPTPQVERYLNNPHHHATAALAMLLRDAEHPVARSRLLTALALPELGEAAVDGLRHSCAGGRLGDALESHHALALNRPRRTLARLKSTDGLVPEPHLLAEATPEQRRGLPAYLAALPGDRAQLIARLLQARKTHDATTRLFVLRRLIALGQSDRDPAVADAVAQFCSDHDEDLARTALWHLIRTGYAELPKLLASLVNGPHDSIRRIAGERLAPVAFARLWAAWPQLDATRRATAGRAIIKLDPTFHRALGDKLAAGDRAGRLRALSIITELNQGAFFSEALIRLTQSPDHHVVSAAVRALGSASGDAVAAALRAALDHADGRVRANAIESLAQQRTGQSADRLAQLADDAEGRPRANAIAALMELNPGEAVQALRRMLADDRADHRKSALWLIENVGLLEVARDVAEHSISDPDPDIRHRAERVIAALLDRMTAHETQRAGHERASQPVGAHA